ncbi:MAG: aminotransferase class III-fold pyridoxal phosphate-dependent enzyme, partial [Pseudomonadota bacterium]
MKTEASAEAAPDTDGRIAKSAASDIHAPLIQPWPLTSSIGHTTLDPLNSGDGIYVWDKDGNRLIDGPAGMWCTNLGHRNTALARAMHDQALELSYNSPWYTTNDPATRFADLITQRAPGDLDHVFFTTGGSTAIETALRFVFFYNNVMGRPGRKLIVS